MPTSGDLVSQIPGAIPQLGGVLINVQNNTGRDFTGSLRLIIAGEPGGAGVSGSSSAAGWSSVSYTYATRTLIMNWSGTVASGGLLPSVVYSLTAHTTGSGTSL
ncbi:hypothetical protein SCB71_03920 [Herbiconiux sp. KACC 21604]|uniref:hypothetical protein n=1 Tax=unclassified Herbiconiux TaxID=2618217 RepID=UPI00149232A2|nr:hypothetical protein [Herbiconiux sp. SALV-R1]QJU52521.1 hypothetical protein HL652_01885 [Herbiconiux sp. SALV-R1]WPO87397.1 hypothetical protein SCB71_03920 [Herbiconiux sp. KACC 21604]